VNENMLDVKCNVGVTQRIMQGKWKLAIMYFLADKTYRFGELHRAMPNIRQGYLTQQLRELESDGVVHREVYKQVPPKVEYSLTPIGREFLPVIVEMEKWGGKYIELLNKAKKQ